MIKEKNLKINMLLSAIDGVFGVIFPLISFPYVSKTLGVVNLGKFNFSTSVISYISLIAALGLSSYAIREGAKIRDNKEKLSEFASEMFSINILSTLLAYALFAVSVIMVPKLRMYLKLLLILSGTVILKTIGVDWAFSIQEDFLYKTVRSLIVHILSLVCLFVFVKDENSLYTYAVISVLSTGGVGLVNFVLSRKICTIRFTLKIDWKRHLKSIVTIFGMSIATTIFVSSDTTILGFLRGDYLVGIYSVSTKVYTIVKTIISSALVASIPRLANLSANRAKKEEYNSVCSDIYRTLITISLPSLVGIIVLSKDIVLLLSDAAYSQAYTSLSILAIALILCMCSYFWTQAILMINGEEKKVFLIVVISAIMNVVLNIILIPFFGENAAAFTTVLSEGFCFLTGWYYGRRYVQLAFVKSTFIKSSIGCCLIVLIGILVAGFNLNYLVELSLTITISIPVYFISQIVLKNDAVMSIIKVVKQKIFIQSDV